MPESFAASLRLAPDALTRPFDSKQFAFAIEDRASRVSTGNVVVAWISF
jgi:hypothetical protein